MESYGITNTGLVRKLNEDAFYCQKEFEKGKPYVCIIADGMGGHNAGEVASSMAISEFIEFLKNNMDEKKLTDIEDYKTLIRNAFLHANKMVYKKSIENEDYIGMGTTLTTVAIINDIMLVAHVGDSRVYLVRDGEIKKLTEDHSYVAELIKNGTIKPEEADSHPQKNLITRAVGTGYTLRVDIDKFKIKPKDFILMCTDGLSNFVEEKKILNIAITNENIEKKCNDLVELAIGEGGYDNITVVAIEIYRGGASRDR